MLPKRKFRLLGAVAALLLAAVPATASAAPSQLRLTDVSFTSDGNTLRGTVLDPPGQPSGHPAVVIVAGAGSTSRWDYQDEARAFARAGIVTLIYDKRSGYSRATTTFRDLADDALAGVRLLRARPEVSPSMVGLWGHSQGGWVVPLAATRSDQVAFVVTVGASALHADRTQLWSDRTYLAHAGVAPELIAPIGLNLSRIMVAAGIFGDTGYDPVAALDNVHQPLLGVFGQYDRSTAPGESLTLFRHALDQADNHRYTLRVVPDASHTMRYSTDGFVSTTAFAPGYLDLITSWINGLAAGPPPVSADPAPAQDVSSAPLTPLSWYESPAVQSAAVLLMLLAFLAYPVIAGWRRLRGRRSAAASWAPRLVAAGGVVVVLGTVSYLLFVVATGAVAVTSSVLGRPPLWLVLQLGTLVVLVTAVLTAVRWRRADGDRRRLGALLAGAVIFLPWAVYWGLLTP